MILTFFKHSNSIVKHSWGRRPLCRYVLLFALMLCSCDNPQNDLAFYDGNTEFDEFEENDNFDIMGSNIISIPFRESNGVKFLEVSINGLVCEMIFDTGCSNTLISIAEANYLYEKGKLSVEDILGISQDEIADGSIVENVVINLREVVVGGKILCENVTATVSNNCQAPLLLGNEILDRASSFSVDNEKRVINFKIR